MSEEMTYGHLGRSGLLVSRIGLETMNFGYTVDESTSFAVMDAAIEAGINFFDAADVTNGEEFRVRFSGVAAPGLRAQIDEAYRVKYGRYGRSYVAAMTSDSAAETTPQLEPAG